MKPLLIFGTGDIARLAHRYFTRDAGREVAGFTVDRDFQAGDAYLGLPLVELESVDRRFPPSDFDAFVALSYREMNRLRAAKCAELKERGYRLATYVSSRCTWLADDSPGENCFILEDNTIQPFVRIGRNVTLWSGNHIGHDSVIEDDCFISSHVVVSGHVRVGAGSFIGVNATIRNGITLARETLVGAGALVMKNTVERGVYIGKRAELLAQNADKLGL